MIACWNFQDKGRREKWSITQMGEVRRILGEKPRRPCVPAHFAALGRAYNPDL